jgi:hypothetical protein
MKKIISVNFLDAEPDRGIPSRLMIIGQECGAMSNMLTAYCHKDDAELIAEKIGMELKNDNKSMARTAYE